MARWEPWQVIDGAYKDDARPWACQDTVNWLPAPAEQPGARSAVMLRTPPGLVEFCDLGTNAPLRGTHDVEGLLLAVSGSTLFRVSGAGVPTAIGTIPGVGRVSMDHTPRGAGFHVGIANGQSGYIYDTAAGSLTQITDEGFPGAILFQFIDGYLAFLEPFGKFWGHSELNDGLNYNTLDRYTAESAPDNLRALIVSHREVFVPGSRTGEFFRNNAGTGAGSTTFSRADGYEMEVGAASAYAVCRLDNTVYWLGDDGIVYRLEGHQPVRVSNGPIEQAVARSNLDNAFAFAWSDKGHNVFYLTLPDGQTWGYDAWTQRWHRRQSYGLNRWRLATLTKWDRQWIGGDYSNGKLYTLSWADDAVHENGEPLVSERTFPVAHDFGNDLLINGIRLLFDSGRRGISLPRIAGDVPDGFVASSVSGAYTVSGGVAPYSAITVTSGTLPPGLTLNPDGTWSGTYTTEGAYSWTVGGTDAFGQPFSLADSAQVSVAPPEVMGLKPKVVSWWDFESNLTDQARGGNTQVGSVTYEAMTGGHRLAAGSTPMSTAGNAGFNAYVTGEPYGNFALGGRIVPTTLTNALRLVTAGVDSGSAVTGPFSLGISAGGKWHALVYNAAGALAVTLTSTTDAVVGTPAHVVLQATANGASTDYALWINGAVEDTETNATGWLQAGGHYVLGTREGGGHRPAVSEVFWAHEVLTAGEIAYLYNGGSKRFYADFGAVLYGTTFDAYLASLLAATPAGVYRLNGTSGTVAADSAPFTPIGNATLTDGASFSNAIAAPLGFGADYVMALDGGNDRMETGATAVALGSGEMLMSAFVYQTANGASAEAYLAAGPLSGVQPAQFSRRIKQGTDAAQLIAQYQDGTGTAFASATATTATRLNAWHSMTYAGFNTQYGYPVMDGIVRASPFAVGGLLQTGSFKFIAGSGYNGGDAIAGYMSRAFILPTSHLGLGQLCKLYDLGIGNG